MIQKALLIAISYPRTSAELRGCVSDQENIYAYLRKACPDCDIRVLSDDRKIKAPVHGTPTKRNILAQIAWLVKGATADTHVWISYSGHGGREKSGGNQMRVGRLQWRGLSTEDAQGKLLEITDDMADKDTSESTDDDASESTDDLENGSEKQSDAETRDQTRPADGTRWYVRRRPKRSKAKKTPAVVDDEIDRMDETIVPCDFRRNGQISDDVLRVRLVDALPSGSKLTAFFDSCHSGTVLDLRYNWSDQNANAAADSVRVVQKEHPQVKESAADVLMISGCRDAQTSADAFMNNSYCGATTQAFLHHLGVIAEQRNTAAAAKMRDERAKVEKIVQSGSGDGDATSDGGNAYSADAQASNALDKESKTRDFGDKLLDDARIDTLEELLHGMNKWMVENHFDQRPQLSMGRKQLANDAIAQFLPLLPQTEENKD